MTKINVTPDRPIYNDDIKEEVRSSVSLENLFRHYGIDASKINFGRSEIAMCCPMPGHDDKHPSFSINSNSLMWHCKGQCDAGGDLFEFIAKMEGLDAKKDFVDILGVAAGIGGVQLKPQGGVSRESEAQMQEVVQGYIDADAFSKEQARQAYLKKKKIDMALLDIEWGAEQAQPGEYDIVIPMRKSDLSGRVLGAQRGRKRMLLHSKVGLFYSPKVIKPRIEEVWVVEGLSDYLSMLAAGYKNTIGLVSASIKTRELASVLEQFKVVHISFDLDRHKEGNDEMGNLTGAKKALSLSQEINKSKTRLKMYELGKDRKFDINDLWQEGGRPALEEFFAKHVVDVNTYATEVGLATNPAGVTCAKLMMDEGSFAIDASKNFYWYTTPELKNVWRSVSVGIIRNEIMLSLQRTRTNGHTPAIINQTLYYLSIKAAEQAEVLKEALVRSHDSYSMKDPEEIHIYLKDGVYYPFKKTDKFRAYVPEDYVFSTIDVSYESIVRAGEYKEKQMPEFAKFLKSIFRGDEDIEERIRFIRQWFGYALVPANPYEKFLFIIGGGGNGKSTLLRVLGHILGETNFANIDIARIANDRFAGSGLLGKYMNLCTEGGKKSLLNDETFKKITGGDTISAEQKYEAQFQFVPFAKFMIATNDEPIAAENEPWLERRLQMISFNNKFVGDDQDAHLKHRLQRERGAIFAWAIEGLRDLVENDGFIVPESAQKLTADFLSSSDYIQGFIEYKNSSSARKAVMNAYEIYEMFTEYMIHIEGRAKTYVPQRKNFVKQLVYKKGFRASFLNGDVTKPILIPPEGIDIDLDDGFI